MKPSIRSVALCITVMFLAVSLQTVGTSPVDNPTPDEQEMTKLAAMFTELLSNEASTETNRLSDVSEKTEDWFSEQGTLLPVYAEPISSFLNILRSLRFKRQTDAKIPVLCMTQECIRILQDLLAKESGILSGRWG